VNTIAGQARDKAAACRQWVAAQEHAIELRYNHIGPGQEWYERTMLPRKV